ncbi:sodium:proton antiporter activity protein [Homalodisca vitripennis]|nr:sodium:proton antiporter activity protein [Homalodisca vitripennis]
MMLLCCVGTGGARYRCSKQCGITSQGVAAQGEEPGAGARSGAGSHDKAWLAKVWGDLDVRYMKPLLTHARPTLLETLPVCCTPLARLLTTTEQLTQERAHRSGSDSDLCLEETEMNVGGGDHVSTFPQHRVAIYSCSSGLVSLK